MEEDKQSKGAATWSDFIPEGKTFFLHGKPVSSKNETYYSTVLTFGIVSSSFHDRVYSSLLQNDFFILDEIYLKYVEPEHIMPHAANYQLGEEYWTQFMCEGENWHEQGDFDTILKGMEENYAKGTKDAEALEALHNLRHFISGPLGNPPLYQPVCFYATRNCQDETGNYDEMYTEEMYIIMHPFQGEFHDPTKRWVVFLWGTY